MARGTSSVAGTPSACHFMVLSVSAGPEKVMIEAITDNGYGSTLVPANAVN